MNSCVCCYFRIKKLFPSKTPSVMKHFLPATRITPPRKVKKVTPTKSAGDKSSASPRQSSKGNVNISEPVNGKSRIPKPVCTLKVGNQRDFNQKQTPVKTKVFWGQLTPSSDKNSPARKRRKYSNCNSPDNKFGNNGKLKSPNVKTTRTLLCENTVSSLSRKNISPNKVPKKVSPTKFKPGDIYADPVGSDCEKFKLRQKCDSLSMKPGLKEQDLNIKVSTNGICSTILSISVKDKQGNAEKIFKKPLSPSFGLNNNSGQVKTPESAVNTLNKFQTSTPVAANITKGLSKSFAPSPINSAGSSSLSRKSSITPPATPVNQGQQSSKPFITPAPSLCNTGSMRTDVFKTPSPVTSSRNSTSTGNSSSVFKTPSPVSASSFNNTSGSAMKSTPPLCKCGRRSKRRMVQSPGQNMGRFFFTCSVRQNVGSKNGCDFFKWETSFSQANTSSSRHRTQYVSKQFTPVSRGSLNTGTAGSFKKNLGMRSVSVTPACSFRV